MRLARGITSLGGHRVNAGYLSVKKYPDSAAVKDFVKNGFPNVTYLFPNTPPDGIEHFIACGNKKKTANAGCNSHAIVRDKLSIA